MSNVEIVLGAAAIMAWLKQLADLTDDERRHMAACDASVAEALENGR